MAARSEGNVREEASGTEKRDISESSDRETCQTDFPNPAPPEFSNTEESLGSSSENEYSHGLDELFFGGLGDLEQDDDQDSDLPSCCHIPDITEYFPEMRGDLSKVTFSPVVGRRTALAKCLEDSSVMVIEMNLLTGRLAYQEGYVDARPVVEEPPFTDKSHLVLEDALIEMVYANKNGARKGMRLVFTDGETLENSLQLLALYMRDLTFPVWLHADIIPGPGGMYEHCLDAEQFIAKCLEFLPLAKLSVGWATPNQLPDDPDLCYSKDMMDEMVFELKNNTAVDSLNLDSVREVYRVNFDVRAACVPGSIRVLKQIMEEFANSTISVWSLPDDKVSVGVLLRLRNEVGSDGVYYNLPQDLKNQFDDAREDEEARLASKFRCVSGTFLSSVTVGVASVLVGLYLYCRIVDR